MDFRPFASPENLRRRAEILTEIRRFFDRFDFVEVQTPILSADTIVDRHVEPVALTDASLPENHHGTRTYYLQTSPEFAMKRLLASGLEAIYQIGPVFRRGDRGRYHNVEFTMLEWYRVGDDYSVGMNRLAELVESLLPEETSLERTSYRDVFLRHVGEDPFSADAKRLRETAETRGIAFPESYDLEDTDPWLDLLFSELVQPCLESTIVYDYPGSQSQLARIRREDGRDVTERFELFLKGHEIANGYFELLDADELRERFDRILRQRRSDGHTTLPRESRLLAAMESGLPPSSGCALGIERLLMALLEVDSIDDVLAFPIEIA